MHLNENLFKMLMPHVSSNVLVHICMEKKTPRIHIWISIVRHTDTMINSGKNCFSQRVYSWFREFKTQAFFFFSDTIQNSTPIFVLYLGILQTVLTLFYFILHGMLNDHIVTKGQKHLCYVSSRSSELLASNL